jgi:toxin-antitoxin system PIN domain toxin
LTYLLDVNVLIAMIDPAHIHHSIARDWFFTEACHAWATCPLVENGAVRIISRSGYGNSPGDPATTIAVLDSWRIKPGHEFWPDDISLLDPFVFDRQAITSHRQITDTYLLALAKKHDGCLATFDRRLSLAGVPNSARCLFHVPMN